MPRVARGLADGLNYHIINRGNGSQQVFHNDGDYRAFVELMSEARERHPVKLMAWCPTTSTCWFHPSTLMI